MKRPIVPPPPPAATVARPPVPAIFLSPQFAALDPAHLAEWRASCVADEFTAQNVETLDGEQAFERIAGEAQRRLQAQANQCADSKLFRFNKNRSPLYGGGWWVSGVDPLARFGPMEWGQLKPNTPRQTWDKKAKAYKPQKYEAPEGTGTRQFWPVVPWVIAERVITRHNATAQPCDRISADDAEALRSEMLYDFSAFWPWLKKHPQIPVLITEGAKKTGAAFTAGFVAIGLPGVWNGRKAWEKDQDGNKIEGQRAELRPELLKFAQPGRKIVFAFDSDEKLKTQQNVWAATEATAFLFLRDTKARPFIASWDADQGKGVDDLIAANGAEALATAVAEALNYQEWRIKLDIDAQFTRRADMPLNQQLLNINMAELPESGIIAIRSPKATGKTQHFLKHLAAEADSGLLIGHLINLTRSNSERLGCTYRTDLDRAAGRFIGPDGEPVYKVSTVINSLMSFSPRDFEGATVIIDEAVQLLRAALTSRDVNGKGARGAILTRLHQIVSTAKRVILADADLDDATIAYFEALRGADAEAFLIHNSYVSGGYPVNFYSASNDSALIADALKAYESELSRGEAGGHVVIPTDSQARAKVIAEMGRQIPGAEVIEIHSQTSGGELEREFIKNPNQYLSYMDRPQLIVFSPSLGTGVSIESPRIHSVWGIFQGRSISDTDILQMLGRVRKPCDRHIWVQNKGSAYSRLGHSGDPAQLKATLQRTTELTGKLLEAADDIRHELTETAHSGLPAFDWENDPHINAFCQVEAAKNRAMPYLRARVLYRLKAEGCTNIIVNEWDSPAMKIAAKATREQIELDEANAKEAAPDIGKTTAALLATKEAPTPAERDQLAKYHLADFYLTQVTAELVLSDRAGRRRTEIRRYEELKNTDTALERDRAAVEKMAAWGEVSALDVRTGAIAANVRQLIGLEKWINRGDSWRGDCAELEAFKAFCVNAAPDIKAALNYTVKDDSSPQKILSELLAQVGIRCESEQKRIDGKRARVYSIDTEAKAELDAIVERRANRPPPVETVEPYINQGVEPVTHPPVTDPLPVTHPPFNKKIYRVCDTPRDQQITIPNLVAGAAVAGMNG